MMSSNGYELTTYDKTNAKWENYPQEKDLPQGQQPGTVNLSNHIAAKRMTLICNIHVANPFI